MKGVRTSIICSLGALAVLAALWGCNGSDIDDPDKSDSLLIVDSVNPASVQADVQGDPMDPNSTVCPCFAPEDDKIEIEVRNMNRTQAGSSIYGDVLLDSFELTCALGTLTIGSGGTVTGSASLTIPADSSASITVVVATGAYKLTNAGALTATGSDTCEIVFNGQDLSGEPIISKKAVFGVSYADYP